MLISRFVLEKGRGHYQYFYFCFFVFAFPIVYHKNNVCNQIILMNLDGVRRLYASHGKSYSYDLMSTAVAKNSFYITVFWEIRV